MEEDRKVERVHKMKDENINSVVDALSGVYHGVKYGVSTGVLMPNAIPTLYEQIKKKLKTGEWHFPKTEEGQLSFIVSTSAGILGTIVPQVLFYKENPEYLFLIPVFQLASYLAERKKKKE